MEQKKLIEELKAVQAKLAVGAKGINDLAAKLAEVEGEQSAAHVAESNLPKLFEQQQDIQADIILGTGKQSDLDKVNKEIAKTQNDIDYHNQTVAGLQRRLEVANNDQAGLKFQKDTLFATLIRDEAEALHSEYMEQAKALVASFRRLKALASIYAAGYTPDAFYLGGEHRLFSLPVFQFPSSGQFPPLPHHQGAKWEVASELAVNEAVYADADINAEKKRLAAMGIEI